MFRPLPSLPGSGLARNRVRCGLLDFIGCIPAHGTILRMARRFEMSPTVRNDCGTGKEHENGCPRDTVNPRHINRFLSELHRQLATRG